MRVVIHADASPAIGTGHLVRSLALAAALRELDVDVTLASDELSGALWRRAVKAAVALVSRDDAPTDPDWIIVDGYHLGPDTRRRLADRSVPRLVIDDLEADVTDAAVVVNQNLYAHAAAYPTGPEVLAGPAYALLRPEFAAARPERPSSEEVERLLVTMGGADPHDATSLVIESLAGDEAAVRVVLGAAHPAAEAVARSARFAGFEVFRDASSLAPHLAWCDAVISGCGSSVVEIARLGRPMIGVVLADNQRRVARAVESHGVGIVAGEHPGLDQVSVRDALDRLRADRAMRERAATVGPALVDGRGAARVARVVVGGPLALRDATLADAEMLLAWRNDPAARGASFDRKPVDPETHREWLARRLGDPKHRLWIGQVTRRPVGSVRFVLQDDTATISVALDPRRRGAGLGTRLIASGCATLIREGAAGLVDAWVRPENHASRRAFTLAGFGVAEQHHDRVLMRLITDRVG